MCLLIPPNRLWEYAASATRCVRAAPEIVLNCDALHGDPKVNASLATEHVANSKRRGTKYAVSPGLFDCKKSDTVPALEECFTQWRR